MILFKVRKCLMENTITTTFKTNKFTSSTCLHLFVLILYYKKINILLNLNLNVKILSMI